MFFSLNFFPHNKKLNRTEHTMVHKISLTKKVEKNTQQKRKRNKEILFCLHWFDSTGTQTLFGRVELFSLQRFNYEWSPITKWSRCECRLCVASLQLSTYPLSLSIRCVHSTIPIHHTHSHTWNCRFVFTFPHSYASAIGIPNHNNFEWFETLANWDCGICEPIIFIEC